LLAVGKPKYFNTEKPNRIVGLNRMPRPRQNGGSKRREFSESDRKPWFKEAFYEIELATYSLLGTSTKA
jgi:hypothetical protein